MPHRNNQRDQPTWDELAALDRTVIARNNRLRLARTINDPDEIRDTDLLESLRSKLHRRLWGTPS